MAGWTLSNGSLEQDFEAWGISNPIYKPISTGLDKFTFSQSIPIQSNDSFAFGSQIILLYNSIRQFVGVVTGASRTGSGDTERTDYEVEGPWHYLANTQMQQSWTRWVGSGIPTGPNNFPAGTTQEVFTPHLILNENKLHPQNWIPLAQQVQDIVQFAIDQGRPIGAIDAGTIVLDSDSGNPIFAPFDEIRDTMCSECIVKELRWCPDAVVSWDYTALPYPKIRIKRRSALASDTIPFGSAIADGAEFTSSVELKERQDMQPASVFITYEIKITVDGKERFSTVIDKWPLTATGLELYAMPLTIEINGVSTKSTKAVLHSQRVAVADPIIGGDQSAQIAWIQANIPNMGSDRVRNLNIISVTRGPFDSLDLTQELKKGQVAPWMSFLGTRVLAEKENSVLITCTYDVLRPDSQISVDLAVDPNDIVKNTMSWDVNHPGQFHHKFTATNSPEGVVEYSTLESVDSGDPIPPISTLSVIGLARYLYEALSELQYDGTITLKEQEVSMLGLPGKTININGGRVAWQTAKMLVQSKTMNLQTGESTIVVGPAKHLGARDLIGLLKVSRPRRRWTAAKTQADGSASSGGSVQLGLETANANTGTALHGPAAIVMKKDSQNILSLKADDAFTVHNGVKKFLWEDGGSSEAIWLP